jgi:hypothetical protein
LAARDALHRLKETHMIPDPSDHTPDCPAQDTGKPPALVMAYDPSVDASSVMISMWERCTQCGAVTAYEQIRMPWRRFHRQWKPAAALWVATWEHRHQLGSRVTS